MDICTCGCHTNKNIMHIQACCCFCKICENNIKIEVYEKHIEKCKKNQELIEKEFKKFENKI